jgi:1,4-alpha-glucan branching enzyme
MTSSPPSLPRSDSWPEPWPEGAPDRQTVQALQEARHGDPFAVLGPHPAGRSVVLRALLPGARQVRVLDRWKGRELMTLQQCPDSDLWCGRCGALPEDYRLSVDWGDGPVTMEDPYRFATQLTETDRWLLGEGNHLRPYEVLGAHPMTVQDVPGVRFAVWAPAAQRVSVVGSFNQWDGRRHPMRLHPGCGVWEVFLPQVGEGDIYHYEVVGCDGELRIKSDPYAFRSQMRPGTASVVQRLPAPVPPDNQRGWNQWFDVPVSLYEVHLGSWRRTADGRWLTYRELAAQLIPYAVEMGFTHLELMPVQEHPFDGSWGYQPTGLYAPTSRYGSPADFKAFVEAAHAAGLGVILDWVPAHFPGDAHGLVCFDGTCLYEHADPREGFHPDWNTLIYNFGRVEVRNFLIGNALYWIERFGVDGLRVDAVASMLYRDYSRRDGEWVPNRHGGRENLEAIDFLRRLSRCIGRERPEAILIAEESTSFPMVTRPPSDDLQSGGLGFHYKWNMGWMNDTLRYMARDPVYRRWHHDELRFSLMYAFSENFILPISHDEVVHGKRSLVSKVPGDDWQRFATVRAILGWMWTHPGKKLLFMGSELGAWDEWNADASLPWALQEQPLHAGLQRMVRDLNRILRHHPALHRLDVSQDGFMWVSHEDSERSVLTFERREAAGGLKGERILVICHFTPEARPNYRLGVPARGSWRLLFNSDDPVYGGSGVQPPAVQTGEEVDVEGWRCSIVMTLPPLSCVMLIHEGTPTHGAR